jgi:hypothetical protein
MAWKYEIGCMVWESATGPPGNGNERPAQSACTPGRRDAVAGAGDDTDAIVTRALVKLAACTIASGLCIALASCGLQVSSPDLFLLQRTGQGRTLRLLVNDGGTISCNSGPKKAISDQLLIQARDLATNLDQDAKANLHIAASANGVYFYSMKLQDGTISFGDTAAAKHHELAQAELFAVQAATGPCGLRG